MAIDSPYWRKHDRETYVPLIIESYPEVNILVNHMYAKHKLLKTILGEHLCQLNVSWLFKVHI